MANPGSDLLNKYFRGEITIEDLKRTSGKKVATKKELEDFLNNSFLQSVMSSTYGISKNVLTKKVKELLDKKVYEATTTSNTGNIDHPWHGWANPEESEEIKKMLKTMSKEDILNWLLKKNRQKPS